MRHVAVVVPDLEGAGLRFLRAGLSLAGARIGLITKQPFGACPPDVRRGIGAHWQVANALDSDELYAAARGIASTFGGLDRFFAVQEHLQLPAAIARARLGVPGMAPDTVQNFRDKARMKRVLRDANVPCARFALARDATEARAAARATGFPLVAKPPSGAGAADTHRIADAGQLEDLLRTAPPRPEEPMLLEEFLTGSEFSFDSVWVGGRMVWHSVSAYLPACLEVKENAWIQWTVLLPRRIDGAEFDLIRSAGEAALRALGFENGMSHMEWFRRPDGSVAIGEAGARPPGAQFTTLQGLAHDTDMYAAWMRLMIHGEFEPPARRFAAGGAYLRAAGAGRVTGVRGVDEAMRRFGPLVAEVKIPDRGTETGKGYEGEGYLLLRHPGTDVVAAALREIVATVHVDL